MRRTRPPGDGCTPSSKTKGWIPVAVSFALALLIRGGRLLATDLAPDAAVSGVMGYAILAGEFPLFFYGQKFMGSLDAFLAAPLYLLLGPSTLTVNLVPLMLSLGALWVIFIILKRVLDTPGRFLGLLFLAVPTAFSLFCLTEGKAFYHLAFFLSALLMWITLKLEKRAIREVFLLYPVWGILAGLAVWTNFLSAAPIAACGVYLLIRIKLRSLLQSGVWVFAGGILGALPLLVFTLFRETPGVGWIQPGSAYSLADRLSAILFTALPIILGINPRNPATGLEPGSFEFIVFLFLLLLLLGASAGLVIKSLRTPRHETLLPVLVLIFSLGAVLAGGRPEEYRTLDQRYLLPLYLGLPFCWGYWADRLRHRKTMLFLLGALLVGVHLVGYRTFTGRTPLLQIKSGHYFSLDSRIIELSRQLRAEGFHHIFNTNVRYSNYLRTFLSEGDPLYCNPVSYEDTRAVARVGASKDVGYWMPLEANFRMLGIPHRLTGGIYHSFSPPGGGAELLNPNSWRAVTLEGRELGPVLQDGDLDTGFNTRGDNPDGQGFLLNLGREETINGLALIPKNYQEVPAGLRIEAAGSNALFRLIREVRGYVGPFYLSGPNPFFMHRYPRMECYFEPQTVRYLRLTQLGKVRKDWPVRELLIFGSTPAAREIPWSEARDRLLKVVAAHPLKNLYADAWPSSVITAASLVRKPGVLLPTIEVDIYGSRGPSLKEPLRIDPTPGNGLLVLTRETRQAATRLTESEIIFNRVPAGRYTLFVLRGRNTGSAIPIVRVTSETNPREASELVRGFPPGKRWSSQGPQRPGMGLTLDLDAPKTIGRISLHCPRHPLDYPRGVKADYSLDGKRWDPLGMALAEPLAFSGQVLLLTRGPVQRYRIKPGVTARYVRLTLTEPDPVNWWSVEKIELHGPSGN